MSFTRRHFIQHRPYLYHFTRLENVPLLRGERNMRSAAAWVGIANAYKEQVEDVESFLSAPRLDPIPLMVSADCQIILNDQRPLRSEANFAGLQGTYEEFLRCLNDLIFFWPGDENGPCPKGSLSASFARRYAHFGCLRVPTADAWSDIVPVRFCCCNSGAPQARDRIERGPHIFRTHDSVDLKLKKVAEVVFTTQIALPIATEWKKMSDEEWEPLFGEDSATERSIIDLKDQ